LDILFYLLSSSREWSRNILQIFYKYLIFADSFGLWWLPGTSISETDGITPDSLIFFGDLVCAAQSIQEHSSCLALASCISVLEYAVNRRYKEVYELEKVAGCICLSRWPSRGSSDARRFWFGY
jgi:hypothetical protein